MSEDALIGALVDGRYRIDRIVGRGGFGTVYAAQHLLLGARVAVKVPRIPSTIVLSAGIAGRYTASTWHSGRSSARSSGRTRPQALPASPA